ncbi:hypothetical protein BsWGS_19959 [Bradybaena similaris]
MAATVLAPGSGGSFLDSPVFSHTQSQSSHAGYSTVDSSLPVRKLFFDSSHLETSPETHAVTSQPNTPDSGFCGAAASTPLKSPESEFSTNVITPPSSGTSRRKRKTVTITESQPTVVVISPDDLFKVYSKPQIEREVFQQVTSDDTQLGLPSDVELACISDIADYHVDSITGWPIKRSESLESRDNPFVPGGELSREAEDLLSRATVVRDHFYLNEDEKRALRVLQQQQQEWQLQQQLQHQQQQQQLQQQQHQQQQRIDKHAAIEDSPDGLVQCQPTCGYSLSSRAATDLVDDHGLLQPATGPGLTAAPANGGFQPKENCELTESLCTQDQVAQTISEDETAHVFGDLQVHESDTKQRNKCCSVM